MAKRREQIRMTDEELAAFLEVGRVAGVATNGRDGYPHVTALWYVMRDGDPWIWTYAKSQKIRNIERDRRATVMVEDGELYQELRGAMIKADAEIVTDPGVVQEVGEQVYSKYTGPQLGVPLGDEVRAGIATRSAKRVAVRFHTRSVASWDHRKL